MSKELDNLNLTEEEIAAINGGKVLEGTYEKIEKYMTKVIKEGNVQSKEYYIDFILHRLLYSDRTIYGKELIDDTKQVKGYIFEIYDRLIKKKKKPILKSEGVVGKQRRFCLYRENKTAGFYSAAVFSWSEYRDSNPRPLEPHSSALPNCAISRLLFLFYMIL